MRKITTFLLFFWLFFFACNSAGDRPKTAGTPASREELQTPKYVYDLEPGLVRADSLQIVYYDNPDGDSLRYTRFFTYTETRDTTLIKTLLNEMNHVYVQEPKTRPCRSDGKLFLLKGENILKTVYFSTQGDSCTYFYFIKDGTFIYFPLTAPAERLLKENRQKAKKPKGTTLS